MNEETAIYKINDKPSLVILNLDTYPMGYGIDGIKIILKGKEFIFSVDEIFALLTKLKG